MRVLERKLGFDIVRETVRGKCAAEGARKMTAEAEIMHAEGEIVQALRLTDEMRLICMFEDSFPSDGFVDMRPFLLPLTSELSCISPPNLVLLQKGLDAIRRIVAFFKGSRGVYPQLSKLSEPVMLYPEILRKIDTIINKHGEVRDNASPELAQIRADLKAKEKSIARTIAAILKKAQAEGITAEDAEVVVRDGKALIPVNASDKRKLQGIVCDESSSGRTSFIEPIEVVNLNNAVRELQFEEQREIQRILMEFSDFIRPYLNDLLLNADFLIIIDFIRAKALTAIDMIAGMPVISTTGELILRKARHPLLERALRKEGKEIVPLTLTLTADRRIILISGPNAGGKSVCLKTVGLLQYMFQWGLLIPTSEVSEMLIFDNIFVDIGDDQSLENDLSTYSSHLQNLRGILEGATDRSLVLIDEFGSGTEPTAGGAIAEAVLDALTDDLNPPNALSSMFEAVKLVNGIKDKSLTINPEDLARLQKLFRDVVTDILGLSDEQSDSTSSHVIDGLMQMIIDIRKEAKTQKNWALSDKIRDELKAAGIQLKDTKDGCEWTLAE